MKKIKLFIIIGIIACLFAVSLVACSKDKVDTRPQIMKTDINATAEGMYFAPIAEAAGYKVSLNGGEWVEYSVDDVLLYRFPEVVGDYTLRVIVLGGAEYKDSQETAFNFAVAKMSASLFERQSNSLVFATQNVQYCIEDEEWDYIDGTKRLMFDNAAVGDVFAIKLFSAGIGWSESDKTYYVDGEVIELDFTVTATLATPVLYVNDLNNGITWNADPNAKGYKVDINGGVQIVSVSECSVSFPVTAGSYIIKVKALPEEGTNYYESQFSELDFTTVQSDIIDVTYDEGYLFWDEKWSSSIMSSNDGIEFTPVSGDSIAFAANMSLMRNDFFDAVERVFYPHSKKITFAQRSLPQIEFLNSGIIKWDSYAEYDENYLYKCYFVTEAPENYFAMQFNSLDIASLVEGEYKFAVYGKEYIVSDGDTAVFYIPSQEASIDFSVLPAPQVSFNTGRLTWESDPAAEGYRYKKGADGAWQQATEIGYAPISDMEYYFVKAIGNSGDYVRDSKESYILADPVLAMIKSDTMKHAVKISDSKYAELFGQPSVPNSSNTGTHQIIFESEVQAEQVILDSAGSGVVKVVAGDSPPKVAEHRGNSDGISIKLLKPIDISEVSDITFRLYITGGDGKIMIGLKGPRANPADGTIIHWESWHNTLELNSWIEVVIRADDFRYDMVRNYAVGLTEIREAYVAFQRNALPGDIFYLESVCYSVVPEYFGAGRTFPGAELGYNITNARLSDESLIVRHGSNDIRTLPLVDYRLVEDNQSQSGTVLKFFLRPGSDSSGDIYSGAVFGFDAQDMSNVSEILIRWKLSSFTGSFWGFNIGINGNWKDSKSAESAGSDWNTTSIPVSTITGLLNEGKLNNIMIYSHQKSTTCTIEVDYILLQHKVSEDSFGIGRANPYTDSRYQMPAVLLAKGGMSGDTELNSNVEYSLIHDSETFSANALKIVMAAKGGAKFDFGGIDIAADNVSAILIGWKMLEGNQAGLNINVNDKFYEWIAVSAAEGWAEMYIPISGTKGISGKLVDGKLNNIIFHSNNAMAFAIDYIIFQVNDGSDGNIVFSDRDSLKYVKAKTFNAFAPFGGRYKDGEDYVAAIAVKGTEYEVLTVYFDSVQLNAGDKIVIEAKYGAGTSTGMWYYDGGTETIGFPNEAGYLVREISITGSKILKELNFRQYAAADNRTVYLKSITIVRAG